MPDSTTRLRVLLYIDSIHCGGAQRQLCHLAIGLRQLGHDVSVAVYYPQFDYFKPTLHENGIRLIELRKRGIPGMVGDLGRTIAELDIDWVVSFLEGPGLYALMTKFRYRNFKICVAERSANTIGRFSLKQRVLRRMYRWADRITTNSEYQADIIRTKYPRLRDRLHTIRNCVGESFLKMGEGRSEEPAEDWNVDRDWLAVVGQIAPWKNLHGLIDGMLEYRQKYGQPVRIRWAGRPAEAFSDYVCQQQQRIVEHQLADQIEFLGNVEDVPAFLREASGLIHPSTIEGFPNAVCEAYAVGLPTLIGDISDARFLAGDGRGLLFDPNSAESIAESLRHFVGLSGPARRKMALAGREFAIKELRQEVMAAKYAALMT